VSLGRDLHRGVPSVSWIDTLQRHRRAERRARIFGSGALASVIAVSGFLVASALIAAEPPVTQKTFATPDEAAQALIAAAESFDVAALKEILGPDGIDLVFTEDAVQDRNQAAAFAEAARQKTQVVKDPKNARVAIVEIGPEAWPMPVPIVEKKGQWSFDSKKGREEVLSRRIGRNELDAIEVCRGFVEAQVEYSLTRHDGAMVNQYAQKIISTPGKQDGLAWQGRDGTWEGPVGEGIARVIAEGYRDRFEPYHGYYFKVLKRQGPDAPLGEMDYVVKGAMIGGFALAAAPAEYGVTGIKSFIVNHAGVVYEKDLGRDTAEKFKALDTYNPDKSWKPVPEP
jgi:hypothetical protein